MPPRSSAFSRSFSLSTAASAWLLASLTGVGLAGSLGAQEGRAPEDLAVALGLLQRGLYEEALPYLNTFLKANPRHPRAAEAWYRVGTCHSEGRRAEPAIQSFQKALAQADEGFPLRAAAQYRLGTLLHENGRHDEAKTQFEALIKGNDDDYYLQAGARYALGECCRDLNDDSGAVQAFLRALQVAKGEQEGFAFPAAYQAGFAMLRLDRPKNAADLFGQAGKSAADAEARGECEYLQGDAAFRAADLGRAAQAYQRSIALGGTFADDAVLGLGFCLLEGGDRPGAMTRFRELVQQHGRSALVPQARLEIGRMQFQDGKADAARAELTTLLQTDDLDGAVKGAALELRGLAALDLGAQQDAARDFAAALPLAGDALVTARVRYGLGEAALLAEDWQGAYDQFVAAAGEGADDALRGDAWYGQSLALHKLGRFADSQKVAAQLLAALPQHRLAVLARFSVAENLFALKDFARADKAYQGVPRDHEVGEKAVFKRGWCAYLGGDKAAAAARFAAMAKDPSMEGALKEPGLREQALSMTALACLEAEQPDQALQAADQYRSRYSEGAYLARTERVAARVLRARGDLRGAAARLAVAAGAAGDPGTAAADALERAELTYQQGDFAGAQRLYEPVAQRDDPNGARALEGLAWCAFELGDDEQCAKLIAAGKQHGHIGDNRAGLLQLEYALHHRRSRWAEAEVAAATFMKDFASHELAPEMRYSLGVAQARGDKLDAARKTLMVAARDKATPRLDRVFYELGWVCRRDGDETAALAAFAEVAQRSNDVDLKGEAELHLGVAALESEQPQVDPAALLAGVQGVYRGRALYRLGFAAFENEQWQPALASFQKLVELGESEPLYEEGIHFVGMSQMGRGDYGAAAAEFAKLLGRNPKHPRAQDARLSLGECAVRIRQPGEAVAPLTQFLAAAGNAADAVAKAQRAKAHLWLGRARQGQDQHGPAQAEFLKVTQLSEGPLAAEAQFRIGESRTARGDLNGAADAFVKLPILYGHEEWVRRGLLHAGLTYQALDQPAKARRFFEELVDRFPESSEAGQAKERLRTQ